MEINIRQGKMNTIYSILLNNTLAIFSVILIESCSDPSNSSPDLGKENECNNKTSTNEFIWAIDTIGEWPSNVGGVHGFSDTNVFAMGYLVKAGIPTPGLHWDGTTWSTNLFAPPIEIGHYSNSVTGDSNIMLSVGYQNISNPIPVIAEFNNSKKSWSVRKLPESGQFYSVWLGDQGISAAGGTNGLLMIRSSLSSDWIKQTVPVGLMGDITKVIGIGNDDLFICSDYIGISGFAKTQFWRKKNSSWTKLYDTTEPDSNKYFRNLDRTDFYNFDINYCEITNTLKFYAFGNPLLTYQYFPVNNRFNVIDDGYANSTSGIYSAKAFYQNDIWFFGTKLAHWDGVSLKTISIPGVEKISNSYGHFMTKTGRVFIPLTNDYQTWVIARGNPKLNN